MGARAIAKTYIPLHRPTNFWPSEVVLLLTSFVVSVLCADFRNVIGFFLSRKGTVLQLSYVFNIMNDFPPLQSTYFRTTLKKTLPINT